jgi:hypothetical protein
LEDAQTQTTSRRDTANIATATITNPRIDFGYPTFLGNANHRDASVWIADCGAKKTRDLPKVRSQQLCERPHWQLDH